MKDLRKDRKKLHSLHDILRLVIIGIICSADSWDAIEEFGKAKIDFLSTFLILKNGIPSHDTISRVFVSINPEAFEKCFISWTNSLKNIDIKKEVVAIDGKTICGSRDSFRNKKTTHLVSAWAGNNQLILGQTKVDGKSNKITTIPVLLDLLDLDGSL